MSTLSELEVLEELSMLWPNNWAFPEANETPKLHTLRLTIIPNTHPRAKREKILDDYPKSFSIRTLEVRFVPPFPTSWHNEYWLDFSFPALRVVTFWHMRTRVPDIFVFIHRHPTILEANLNFRISERDYDLLISPPYEDSLSIRLEAIIKLIDGTGMWAAYLPSNELWDFLVTNGDGELKGIQPFVCLERDLSEPDNLLDGHYSTVTFAFKRAPITPDALQWDRREGSRQPRYRATELSIKLDAKDRTSEYNKGPVRSGKFHDFFLLGDIDLFQELEVLTIICDTSIPKRTNFVDYVVSVLPSYLFSLSLKQVIMVVSDRYPIKRMEASQKISALFFC